jgi:polyferredoxin
MKLPKALILIALLLLWASSARGAAVPEFDSSYHVPAPAEPSPRGDLPAYADLAALTVALGIAAWLALKRRSRQYMFGLMVLSIAYFGFYRHGCVCSVGSVQNMALALFDSGYAVPLTVVGFFILPLVFTLFFGRVFCSGVCPLGAIQDLFLLKPIKVPAWLEHALGLLAWIYLGAAILFAATASAFIICEYDPFISFFRRTGSLSMLLFGSSFLLLGMFVGRPYCRFLCPYGALLGFFSRFSRQRVTITPDKCLQCRLCEDACPFGAIQEPDPVTVRERSIGAGRLAALFALLAILIVLGGWGGRMLAPAFSYMHSTVRLAERVYLEETGVVADTTHASDAFRKLGETPAELYAECAVIRQDFSTWGLRLGILVGAVVGLKLIALFVRRRRIDWEASRANCLACARCFEYCPQEHVRLQKLALPAPFSVMFPAPAVQSSAVTRTAETPCCAGDKCQPKVQKEPVEVSHINWTLLATSSAFVTGAFALTIVAMILVNHVHSSGAGPLNNVELAQMKQELAKAPENEELKTRLRDMDRQLRSEFFQRQRFAESGRSMILLGIAAFWISLKLAVTFSHKLPKPLAVPDPSGRRARRALFSRYAVAALAILVGSSAGVLALKSTDTVKEVIHKSDGSDTEPASHPPAPEQTRSAPPDAGEGHS